MKSCKGPAFPGLPGRYGAECQGATPPQQPERVGEVAVKNVLAEAKVSFRGTKRAERIPGFDPAPDFIIRDEFAPVALIEAKLTEDDGTARDKMARV